ncbi:MAG: RHS repeat-associated core domain-containing protein, partial [Lachnospiraceae bacterium]|nr:RHS repeat-associated core domain-containing protein [Lachnospiraceae bacterium]
NEFLYTGEQYNANTGLYYLRARYMNPSTGTFISMDSYQGSIYDPVTLHKYLYAGANPVTYVDPSGYSFSKQEMDVAVTGDSILAVGYAWNSSVVFKAGMATLNKLWAIKEVQAIAYVAVDVLLAIVIYDALNSPKYNSPMQIALEMLEDALSDIQIICEETEINSESIAIRVKEALDQAKDNGKSTDKGKEGGGDKNNQDDKRDPRSKNPPARRKRYSSKKEAYEAAKRAGKGKEPRHDPSDPNQDPHYHPNVKNPQRTTPKEPCSHDHYYYPK